MLSRMPLSSCFQNRSEPGLAPALPASVVESGGAVQCLYFERSEQMSRSKRSGGRRRGSSVAQATTTTARARPAQDAQRARRSGALARPEATIALGALVFLLGGYWDVAWHIEIGRDTFWSPPHLVLYSGILLILAACAYAFAAASRLGSAGRRAWPGPG